MLSILLPVYNAEMFLEHAIEGILSQSFEDFELLICDDASTDSSFEIAQSYHDDRIKIFRNELNEGKNRTCNLLLQKARGTYISVHDADDVSMKGRFAIQVEFLMKNPSFVMCGCNFYTIDNRNRALSLSRLESDYSSIKRDIYHSSQFHGPTLVFRRDIVNDVGGLYRYFRWGEDIDFAMRVVERYKATNLNDALYFYRVHGHSLTKSLDGFTEDRLLNKLLRQHLASQRYETGTDSLMSDNQEGFLKYKRELAENIALEPDGIAREGASYFFHTGLLMFSLIKCIEAVRKRPFRLINWKHFVTIFLKIPKQSVLIFYNKRKFAHVSYSTDASL